MLLSSRWWRGGVPSWSRGARAAGAAPWRRASAARPACLPLVLVAVASSFPLLRFAAIELGGHYLHSRHGWVKRSAPVEPGADRGWSERRIRRPSRALPRLGCPGAGGSTISTPARAGGRSPLARWAGRGRGARAAPRRRRAEAGRRLRSPPKISGASPAQSIGRWRRRAPPPPRYGGSLVACRLADAEPGGEAGEGHRATLRTRRGPARGARRAVRPAPGPASGSTALAEAIRSGLKSANSPCRRRSQLREVRARWASAPSAS